VVDVTLTAAQRAALEAAARAEKRTRAWKRYQAVLLLAEGQPPAVVAHNVKCGVSSVYNWAATWRRDGVAGLAEGPHPGAARRLEAAGKALLEALLERDPQGRRHRATNWTVPLLRTELAQTGYAVSGRTVRRALHRLGYRWKRPQYVLGRPDPEYEAKKGG
jgi:transposase